MHSELDELHRATDGIYKNIIVITCNMPHRETCKVVLIMNLPLAARRELYNADLSYFLPPTETR